jgi:DNA-binding SARP family transcriptional activator/TolB-like protein
MIEVKTLGRGAIFREGIELTELEAQRQKFAILVYLLMEGPVSRDRLLTMFWPERSQAKARHSLSQVLYALRRELGEECLHSNGDELVFDGDQFIVDATQLDAAAHREDWEKVVDLYEGTFLEQFSLPGAPEFEQWCSRTRVQLARTAHRGFSQVVNRQAESGDLPSAVATGWRWVGLEPLDDEAQHALIALLAASGSRTAALEHYESYRERLAIELEVEPLEETIALVDQIRAGQAPSFQPLAKKERPSAQTAGPEPTAAEHRPIELGWRSTFAELRRRHVFLVGLAYLAVAWLAFEFIGTLVEYDIVGRWALNGLLLALPVGLLLVLAVVWAHELPDGPYKRFWPRWAESVKPRHMFALMGALFIGLLAGERFVKRSLAPFDIPLFSQAGLDRRIIAVLPFDVVTEGVNLEWLELALTDRLIDELTYVEGIKVRPVTAVKRYRHWDPPMDTINLDLAAGTLVEGTIVGSAEQVQVTMQLVDAESGEVSESNPVQRPRHDEVALLNDLVANLGPLLREWLGRAVELPHLTQGAQNVQAWELVEEAEILRLEALDQLGASQIDLAGATARRADSLLVRATALDPAWPEPSVRRGWLYNTMAQILSQDLRVRDPELLRAGIDHANRALELDADNPEALELRGSLRYRLLERADETEAGPLRRAAEMDLRSAIALNPRRPYPWFRLSKLLVQAGQPLEAKEAALQAYLAGWYGADDQGSHILVNLCHTSLNAEQWDEVARWCELAIARYPDNRVALNAYLLTLASKGGPEPDPALVREAIEKFLDVSPEHERNRARPSLYLYLAAVFVRAGYPDSARVMIEQAREADVEGSEMTDYNEAYVRVLLGEHSQALTLLAKYLEARPAKKDGLARDWWFEDLFDDPRFKALVE